MTTTYEAQPPTTTPEVGGMGHARKRVEDARFIRGAGHYIDDINLPGQLWLDIVRSPYAHATIRGIDASEALKVPGVAAVITGADLEKAGLHWMPTLAGDKQMVLPTHTVMFQSQEVAAVVATSRYAAADGVAAVLVDYEPLPVVVDPSHGTGHRDMVPAMARAAVAAGADGLLIEVHPNPERALSDGAQSMYPREFERMMKEVVLIAEVIGRSVATPVGSTV